METVVTVGSMQTTDKAREEGEKREEGEARQEARETEPSQEDMDGPLQAVADAISRAEREAADGQEDPQAEAYGAQEARTARDIHEHREANARQVANEFLQAMEGTCRDQTEGTTGEGSTRRRGKEPASGGTQAEEMQTPPEHCPQQRTPPTRAYGGAGPSRFRPTPPTQNRGTAAGVANQEE